MDTCRKHNTHPYHYPAVTAYFASTPVCTFTCLPGVLVAGGFGNFCTEATGFSRQFPGLKSHLLMLPFWFRVPFFRDYIMCGGTDPSVLPCPPPPHPPPSQPPSPLSVCPSPVCVPGLVSSSKSSLSYLISRPEGGNVAVIAVGGAPESLDARPGALTLQVSYTHTASPTLKLNITNTITNRICNNTIQ